MGKRMAARLFDTEAVNHLDVILAKLNALDNRNSAHSRDISNYVQEGKEREQKNLTSSVTILDTLKKDLEKMSNAMKNRIKSEDKLLASMTNTARDGIQKAASIFSEGENSLESSLKNIQHNFSDFESELNTMRENISKSSTEALDALQKNVLKSREQLAFLINTASTSLSNLRSKNLETREKISLEAKNLRGKISSSSLDMEQISEEQQNKIKGSIEVFKTSGMQHFNGINNALSDQITLIDEKSGYHHATIAKLDSSLQDQRDKFHKSQREQLDLQERMVTNVLSDVEKLIKKHVGMFSKQQEKHLHLFEHGVDNLREMNRSINTSVSDTFSNVKETNSSIVDHVNCATKNESEFTDMAMIASSQFSRLNERAKDHGLEVKSHGDRIEAYVGELLSHDRELQECEQVVVKKVEDIQNFTLNTFHCGTEKALTDLTTSANRHLDYAQNTINSSSRTGIDDVQVPRNALYKDVTNKLDATLKVLKEGDSQLKKSFTEQCLLIDGLTGKVDSEVGDFCTNVDRIKYEMEAEHESLASSSEEFTKVSTQILSDCTTNSSMLKECVKNFVKEKIECHDEAPPILEQKKIEYSRSFTSTPSSDVILKSVELPKPPNLDVSVDSISTKSDEISQSPLSTESVVDACSTIEGKVPLGEVSLDRQNVSDNLKKDENTINQKEKPIKNFPLNTSKKRSSSRQRATPVRKRFAASTPTRRQKQKWKERK
jgi:hypothetical protein